MVTSDVVKPLYLSVVEVAFPFDPPLHADPDPHVPVEISVPNPEYPKYEPVEVADQILGEPV